MDTRTRIQDIPISGKTKKRTTGIVGLNLLLDGGFPEGTLVMIYGTPLAGVDLAANQFWQAEGGEEGTYLMNDGDIEIGMIDATELHPEMYLTQMAGSRIVVDSLSTIIIKYGIDGALKFLRLAREEIRKRGANLVFVVYTGIHTPDGDDPDHAGCGYRHRVSRPMSTRARSSGRSRCTRSGMRPPPSGCCRSLSPRGASRLRQRREWCKVLFLRECTRIRAALSSGSLFIIWVAGIV